MTCLKYDPLRTDARCGAPLHDLASFRDAAARWTAANTRTPQDAIACLVRLGIYLPDGTLAPEYRR